MAWSASIWSGSYGRVQVALTLSAAWAAHCRFGRFATSFARHRRNSSCLPAPGSSAGGPPLPVVGPSQRKPGICWPGHRPPGPAAWSWSQAGFDVRVLPQVAPLLSRTAGLDAGALQESSEALEGGAHVRSLKRLPGTLGLADVSAAHGKGRSRTKNRRSTTPDFGARSGGRPFLTLSRSPCENRGY